MRASAARCALISNGENSRESKEDDLLYVYNRHDIFFQIDTPGWNSNTDDIYGL